MEYNAVELVISMLFSFLVGFVIAKLRVKDAWKEALYRANPELRPAMTFTINDNLEILWYRYEGLNIKFLATVITEENRKTLCEYYNLIRTPNNGDYLMLVDNDSFIVNSESFNKTYKRLLTV